MSPTDVHVQSVSATGPGRWLAAQLTQDMAAKRKGGVDRATQTEVGLKAYGSERP